MTPVTGVLQGMALDPIKKLTNPCLGLELPMRAMVQRLGSSWPVRPPPLNGWSKVSQNAGWASPQFPPACCAEALPIPMLLLMLSHDWAAIKRATRTTTAQIHDGKRLTGTLTFLRGRHDSAMRVHMRSWA